MPGPIVDIPEGPETGMFLRGDGTWVDPTAGIDVDPTLGGDLTGTASAAVIADGAVTAAKLSFDPATQAELDAHVAAADPHPQYVTVAEAEASGAALWVPLEQTQGGTPLNPTPSTDLWRFNTANNYTDTKHFGLKFIAQTFVNVGTAMSLGYNPEFEVAGEPAAFIKILADAQDTPGGALEIEWVVNYPDGTIYLPIQCIAPRNNSHIGSTSFQHGPGGGSLTFNNADGTGYLSMSGASTGVPGTIGFFQPMNVAAAATLSLHAPATWAADTVGTAITIHGSNTNAASMFIRDTAGYIQKAIAAPLDKVLLTTPPAATAGATTKHGASLYLGTSYWNGSASAIEYATLDVRRGSTIVGAHFFQMNSGLFIQSQAPSGTRSLTVRQAAGTAALPIAEFQDSAGNPLSRIDKNGYFTTRKVTAPADGDLVASEMAFWFDPTPGAAKLMIKGKDSSGTVVSGSVALT